jgi:AsmA protein
MIPRARARTPAKARERRGALLAGLAALGLIVALIALANAPYLFKATTLQRAISRQVRLTTGLSLSSDGVARFALLPQPHVVMANLHLADPSGTLTIDADAFEGEVRLLPLVVGRLELASATLDHPRLAIDLDGKAMPADSTIGRALRPGAAVQGDGNERLGIVTLVDGTAAIHHGGAPGETLVTAINITVDWRNLDAPATLTGTVDFHDAPMDVAAWVGQPSSLMRGDHSPIALRIQSVPLDLSANGEVEGTPVLKFHGRVSVATPSLGAALALAGTNAALPAPFADLALTSEATIGAGAVDLPDLKLRVDGNDYEGTIALLGASPREGRDKPALSGTLATDQLSLAPFLSRAPPLLNTARGWNTSRFGLDPSDKLDLDLRISATRLRVPPLVIGDAALAVMTRDDRTELALVEGKAYGGSVKGRASIGLSDKGLSLRAAGSVADLDAGALSWDLFGRQRAAGTLSASLNLETAGDTPAALVANARGWVRGSAIDGEISEVDLGHGLREIARQRLDVVPTALREGRTTFQILAFAVALADGVATIEDGALKGSDCVLTLEGKADLAHRALDLVGLATAPSGEDGAPPRLRFGIAGSFDQAVVSPDLRPITPAARKP